MSLAKYRKIFKDGVEVNYPVYGKKNKDQQDGSQKEKSDSIPKEDQVGNG